MAWASRIWSFLQIVVTLAATVLAILAATRTTNFLGIAENWAADVRVSEFSAPRGLSERIVLAAITEETLATFPYRSPIDRGFVARLLADLEAKGVRAIGLDLLLDQPTEKEKDEALGATLKSLAIPLVVASAGTDDGLSAQQAAFLEDYLEGVETGPVNFAKDPIDGTVRWIFPGKIKDGRLHAGLAPAIAGHFGIKDPGRLVPIVFAAADGPDIHPFRTFPAHDIEVLPESWFAGKIVLVGADLPMIDRHRTPFAATKGIARGSFPGLVIHAYVLEQLLKGVVPWEIGLFQEAALLFALALIAAALARVDMPLPAKSGLNLFVIAALWGGGIALYRFAGAMIPVISPGLVFISSFGIATAYYRRRERRLKKFLRRAFSQYVSPSVVDRLVADPGRLSLGGEKRRLSIVFSDLAGFTTFCEHTDPHRLVPVLNAYLDGLSQVLIDHGGTLDGIAGDSVYGFFGAPEDQPDHADRAIACALDMDRFGQRFAAEQNAEGLKFGVTRIGVHTGSATVGNFGGEKRFNYTALGDAINTASRLESVNKSLGTRVCVSGDTVGECSGGNFRPVGDLILKGKSVAIGVFEPLTGEQAAAPETAAYFEAFDLMKRSPGEALAAFERLVRMNPEDGLAATHLKRLKAGEDGVVIRQTEK